MTFSREMETSVLELQRPKFSYIPMSVKEDPKLLDGPESSSGREPSFTVLGLLIPLSWPDSLYSNRTPVQKPVPGNSRIVWNSPFPKATVTLENGH